jgi:HlyD family secretion protein
MRKLLTPRNTLIALVLILVVAGLFYFRSRQNAAAIEYFTLPVETGSLRNLVNATGVVQTVVTVQVGSQVSGQVEALYADYNSMVRRGQLLAKLDPRNFQAQLENSRANVTAVRARVQGSEAELRVQAANLQSAKASLEGARVARDNAIAQFQRMEDLNRSGLIATNEYDDAKANADSSRAKFEQAQAAVAQVEAQTVSSGAQLDQVKALLQQAQADLNRAQLNLEYCNIYSPVDGVVISRNIDVGQTIAASLQSPTLFSIANDLSRMQVNASVDEADIGNISDEAVVKFTVDAYPNDVFTGQISEIRLSPQTVQNVVTYSVILAIDNSELKLKPGMTANITVTVDQRDNVTKVSNAALRYTPAGMLREEPGAGTTVLTGNQGQPPAVQTNRGNQDAPPAHLAPGQNWNPSDKIKFVLPRRTTHRPAIVFVLNAQGKPELRNLVLGITDGSATEVASGDLKPGDRVVTGDSSQAVSRQANSSGPFGGGRGPL